MASMAGTPLLPWLAVKHITDTVSRNSMTGMGLAKGPVHPPGRSPDDY